MIRPKAKEPKHQFSVMLKPSVVNEIDHYAEKYELTRSGLDELKALDKIGVVPTVFLGTKIMSKFREAFSKGKVSIDEKGDIEIK
jgi:hypothetical protein